MRMRCVALAAMTVLPHFGCARAVPPVPEYHEARRASTTVPIGYPEMLRSANIEGEVTLDVGVDSTGRFDRATSKVVHSTHDLFTAAVLRSLRATAFEPARRGATAVASTRRDTVAFLLTTSADATCPVATEHHATVCGKVTTTTSRDPMTTAEREQLLARLREGRERWLRERPRRYLIEATTNPGMIAMIPPPPRVVSEVLGGRIVKVTRSAPGAAEMRWMSTTVDKLFDFAEEHIRTTTATVQKLDLDPRYGFPRHLVSDVYATTDSRTEVRVLAFTPLP